VVRADEPRIRRRAHHERGRQPRRRRFLRGLRGAARARVGRRVRGLHARARPARRGVRRRRRVRGRRGVRRARPADHRQVRTCRVPGGRGHVSVRRWLRLRRPHVAVHRAMDARRPRRGAGRAGAGARRPRRRRRRRPAGPRPGRAGHPPPRRRRRAPSCARRGAVVADRAVGRGAPDPRTDPDRRVRRLIGAIDDAVGAEPANGDWRLRVVDTAATFTGEVTMAGLDVTTITDPPPAVDAGVVDDAGAADAG
jgi:hypothetical protein